MPPNLEAFACASAAEEAAVRIASSWRRGLLRKTHSAQKVLETWVRAKVVNPKIGLEEVGDVGGSLLISLLQKIKRFFLVAESCVNGRNHVGGDILFPGLSQQITQYLLRLSPFARRYIGVCQSSSSVCVTVRQLNRLLILGNGIQTLA